MRHAMMAKSGGGLRALCVCTAVFFGFWGAATAAAATGHRYIMVDQFGYRPGDPKIAVVADPREGYNADDAFAPTPFFEVRRADDDEPVFATTLEPFQDGAVHPASGDAGFWFDFSPVRTPGSYYLYDPVNDLRSHIFDIRVDVYSDVLKAALRVFFYNRSGIEKRPPFADPRWSDAISYAGPGQDAEARSVADKRNPGSARDLRGGWFDAGDTNKYVSNATLTIHQLLAAYRENTDIWTDDVGIPESGNGVPDLIDEIVWEIDWLERMQEPDGGVLSKLGALDHAKTSPPSADRRPRFYVPSCSSSTIAAAGAFAHAATVFSTIPSLAERRGALVERAERAWRWYADNPQQEDCDDREVKSGDSDRNAQAQDREAVVAAVYLFAGTGKAAYRDYVASNYGKLRPFHDIGWSRYDAQQGEALLYFTTLQGADPAASAAILDRKRRDAKAPRSRDAYAPGLALGLYRAYVHDSVYHWGSNRVKANYGNSNLDLITYDLAGEDAGATHARALGFLHYLHGVNPQGLVYLSNMSDYGAEVSVAEIYHYWYFAGTPWHSTRTSRLGPAPGYLVGGPNARYSGPLSPPAEQPLQKSFSDQVSGRSRDRIWEVAEPSINYQAAYIKLLSKFVSASGAEGPAR